MATVQLLHYKEHLNGARFDGTCKVYDAIYKMETNQTVVGNFMPEIRFIFKFSSFTGADDTVKYVFDIGWQADNHIKFGVRINSGKFYPHLIFFNREYSGTSEIYPNRSYQMQMGFQNYPYLKIMTKYGKLITIAGFDVSLLPTFEATVSRLTIGTEYGGTNGLAFSLFAFEIQHYDDVYSSPYENIRWLWLGYNVTGTYANDYLYFQVKSGDYLTGIGGDKAISITDKPSNFWITETYNISDYVSERVKPEYTITKNTVLKQEIPKFELEVFNYPYEISKDDLIVVFINNVRKDIFIITNIVTDRHYSKLILEGLLKEADKMQIFDYFSGYWDPKSDSHEPISDGFLHDDFDNELRVWWCGITSSEAVENMEYYNTIGQPADYRNWINFKHVWQRFIDFLQLRNIIELGFGDVETNTDTLYYSHENSAYIHYEDIIFRSTMMQRIGFSDEPIWLNNPLTSKILIDILFVTFCKYRLSGDYLLLYAYDYGEDYDVTDDVSNNYMLQTKQSDMYLEKNIAASIDICKIAAYKSPDITLYDDDYTYPKIANTIEEIKDSGGYGNYMTDTNIYEISFEPHFYIAYLDGTTPKFMFYDNDHTSTFLYQLTKNLNERKMRGVRKEIVIPINISLNSGFETEMIKRSYDLKNKLITAQFIEYEE